MKLYELLMDEKADARNKQFEEKADARFKHFEEKIDERFGWFKETFATKADLHREMGSLKEMIERNNNTTLRWVFLFWVAQLSAVIVFLKYLK